MASQLEILRKPEKATKFNLAKFPYIKIFNYLLLDEQLVLANLSKNVRARILSYSKLLNLFIKIYKKISIKVGVDFNLEEGKKVVSLFENDFKKLSNFIEENKEFSKKISHDKMIELQAFILIKNVIELSYSKNKMIYNKEVLKINKLDELRVLTFKKFKLKNHGAEVIFRMFSLISKINLKKFYIDGLDLSQNKLEEFNFMKNSDYCIKLKHLNLSHNKIENFCEITKLVNFCPYLEYFDLSYNLIKDDGVEFFVRKIDCSKIITLILDGNTLTNHSGNQFFELFSYNKNIKCLTIKHNPMDCIYNNFFSIRQKKLTDFLDLSSSEEINSKLEQIYSEIIETNLYHRLVGIKISSTELSEMSSDIFYKILDFPQFLFLTFSHYPLDLITRNVKIFIDIILNIKRNRFVDFTKLDFTLCEKQISILCNFLNKNQDIIPYIYIDNKMTLYEYPEYIKFYLNNQKSLEYLNLREFNHEKICESTLISHTHYVTSLMQSNDGILISASLDKTIKLWDVSNKIVEHKSTIYTNVENMNSFLFLPDNKILVKTYEGVIKILEKIPNNFQGEKFSDFKCTFSLDKFGQQGPTYCLGNEKIAISGWWYEKDSPATNPNESFKNYFTFIKNYEGIPDTILLLSNGKMATASKEKSIFILDSFDNYSIVDTLIGHKNSILCLLMLPDGKIVSGSKDKKIKIWNKNFNNKFECIATLREHKSCVTSLLLLPDGKFASGSKDSKIIIWSYDYLENKFKCLFTISGHDGPINSMILLKDGRIASASNDCVIKIWK
jgi:WD40 repeat protein